MPQTISPKIAWSWMLAVVGSLLLLGLVLLSVFSNRPQAGEEFPVQGFDVSHHQGDIDWKQISPKRYQFVYLKATEGGDFQDRKFQHNWLAAREQGLRVGAYHFTAYAVMAQYRPIILYRLYRIKQTRLLR